ncbi:hypothetical protein BDW02DRAFT_508536, partial [Decorospora gaudefroyi]
MPPRPFPLPLRVGTDICSVARVRAIITRGKDNEPQSSLLQFMNRIFTDLEQHYFWQRFAPVENILSNPDVASQYLAGRYVERFAAKEAVRKACVHLDSNSKGFRRIIILPVTDPEPDEPRSPRPQGLILDKAYYNPYNKDKSELGIVRKTQRRPRISELNGQLCEVSISHDGDFATAVAIV